MSLDEKLLKVSNENVNKSHLKNSVAPQNILLQLFFYSTKIAKLCWLNLFFGIENKTFSLPQLVNFVSTVTKFASDYC